MLNSSDLEWWKFEKKLQFLSPWEPLAKVILKNVELHMISNTGNYDLDRRKTLRVWVMVIHSYIRLIYWNWPVVSRD